MIRILSVIIKVGSSLLYAKICRTMLRVGSSSMIGDHRQLVTNEPVEFENILVEVQDCKKITDHFRRIYRRYPNFTKENRRMSTCNQLDLQTLGSQPAMPENLPDHWSCVLFVPTLNTSPKPHLQKVNHAIY